jgi:hypothetical protein
MVHKPLVSLSFSLSTSTNTSKHQFSRTMPPKSVINKMRKPELISTCEDAGISTGGTVVQLKARLIAHLEKEVDRQEQEGEGEDIEMEDEIEGSPPPLDTNTLPALVYNTVDVDPTSTEKEGIEKCEQDLRRVIEEGLSVRASHNKKFASNDDGYDLMDKMYRYELLALQSSKSIAELQGRIAQLQTDRADDRRGNDIHSKIRCRFISGFKRLRGIETASDTNLIKSGNIVAHGGDPVYDASLYLDGIRNDKNVYTLLYGLAPARVHGFSKPSLSLSQRETAQMLIHKQKMVV